MSKKLSFYWFLWVKRGVQESTRTWAYVGLNPFFNSYIRWYRRISLLGKWDPEEVCIARSKLFSWSKLLRRPHSIIPVLLDSWVWGIRSIGRWRRRLIFTERWRKGIRGGYHIGISHTKLVSSDSTGFPGSTFFIIWYCRWWGIRLGVSSLGTKFWEFLSLWLIWRVMGLEDLVGWGVYARIVGSVEVGGS